MYRVCLGLVAVSASSMLVTFPSQAQTVDLPRFSIQAKDLLAQEVKATQITGIKLNSTDKGLEIILETPIASGLTPLIYPQENTLIIDILDVVLTLANGQEAFKAENPSDEIAEVTVTQLNASSIRLTVTGKNNIPTAQVVPSDTKSGSHSCLIN